MMSIVKVTISNYKFPSCDLSTLDFFLFFVNARDQHDVTRLKNIRQSKQK